MPASFFYQGKDRKWQVMHFGDDHLQCYVTAIRYLQHGYTVGLNEETAAQIKDLKVPEERPEEDLPGGPGPGGPGR